MRGIRILFIFAFAKELIPYLFSPFIILIISIPKMENLGGLLWRADNALPPVFSLASYTMQPNPVKDYVQVSSSEPLSLGSVMEVIDQRGKIVHRQKVTEAIGLIELELGSLSNGVYMLRLIDKKGIAWMGKLVLIKD